MHQTEYVKLVIIAWTWTFLSMFERMSEHEDKAAALAGKIPVQVLQKVRRKRKERKVVRISPHKGTWPTCRHQNQDNYNSKSLQLVKNN